jgi:hypothetical protein
VRMSTPSREPIRPGFVMTPLDGVAPTGFPQSGRTAGDPARTVESAGLSVPDEMACLAHRVEPPYGGNVYQVLSLNNIGDLKSLMAAHCPVGATFAHEESFTS